MNKKILIGILALSGVAALGWITFSFFDFDDPAFDEMQRLLFIEGSSQFLSATDPAVMQEAPRLGHLAPQFELSALDGTPHALSSFRGRPLLINFWATWCPSCRAELATLQEFSDKYQGKIQVLGVNWGESQQAITRFLDNLAITFPTLLDGRGTAFVSYQLTGVPTTLFLDAQGVIRGIWLGPMTLSEIETGFARFWDEGRSQ